ncbi:ring-cleaving dioxygenase [Jannaschia pagri]|uniref:Ring-cleaving dioxygenase n=1 Tax=Jannaschia pagri TaxID=2829797 RepID=A0ABQ4NKL4_9RHOB|nr:MULTISPECIES: VOC family protein [unclassified Jannaschia]GIT91125.1 ring-cleaving dioxygenase [Jannaschia sp. AI_61]GIT94957.1 ring-cleaving dioxygenase [Jannaschia sp. AI_62]
MKIDALDHLVLTVADPEATAAWYDRVLGTRREVFRPADGTTRLALSFGSQKINLHAAGAEFRPHAAHPGPGTADMCFLSDAPLSDWQTHLADEGVPIEEGPVPRTGATGPILSIYLRDPDGNLIEIANRV